MKPQQNGTDVQADTKVKVRRLLGLMRGQRVIARHTEDGFYYSGQVVRVPDKRHTVLKFEDLGEQKVPSRFVIPISGAVASPKLRIGDYLLARVVNQDTGLECYVPGVLQMTPAKVGGDKYYTVILYTGQQEHFLRGFLVKIAKIRYTFLVRFIDDLLCKKEEEQRQHRSASSSRGTSRTHSRASSKSRSRSQSSKSRSRSRSKSRSRSRSPEQKKKTRAGRRSSSPQSPAKDQEAAVSDEDKQTQRMAFWQRQLEKQQRRQDKQQRALRKQTKRLSQLQRQLQETRKGKVSPKAQKNLLKMIVEELNKEGAQPRVMSAGRESQSSKDSHVIVKAEDSSKDTRTQDWVLRQSSVVTAEQPVSGESSDKSPPFLVELRHKLAPLNTGEEILARWIDDGWYYRGIIRYACGDLSYFVEDGVGDLERIWREDIISDLDDANTSLKPRDAVIALHPSYSFSYAPGVTLATDVNDYVTVRLYDGSEAKMPREEVYKISPNKFETDVGYIVKCEDLWLGQVVVAKNSRLGLYQLGQVNERVGDGRQYRVEFADGHEATLTNTCMFGALTRRHPLHVNDCVLAIADEANFTYLPGKILAKNEQKVDIRFCNNYEAHDLDMSHCFWLSQDYYKMAVESFFKKHQSMMSSRSATTTATTTSDSDSDSDSTSSGSSSGSDSSAGE